ncbi:MAG TPA: hypothetical protein VEH76_01285 [Methylocystis sp.]|nr:hypothetical protein [Methylocystis sp.]
MTITLELSPELESGLSAMAAARGLSLPEYLKCVLEEQLPPQATAGLSPEGRAAAWREAARDLPHTPPLSDEAISRESIYGERG